MTVVLGIKPTMRDYRSLTKWGGHDPGACIISEGNIVAMAEEERFNREKRAPKPNFPEKSIKFVLDEAGTDISEVDAIAIGTDHKEYIKKYKKEYKSLIPSSIGAAWETVNKLALVYSSRKGIPIQRVSKKLDSMFDEEFTGKWYQIPHHRCHAASAAYCSDRNNQITITVDGRGEADSTVIWDTNLNRVKEFPTDNSIGLFYDAGCYYLGFRRGRDAGKVMGLASYGEYREEFKKKFDKITNIGNGTYDVTSVQSKTIDPFEEHFGPKRVYPEELNKRHKDFAYHLQLRTENIMKELVRHHVKKTGCRNIALAGGVAMNCKMNREIKNMEVIDDLFIQPAANDSGICLGAALEGYRVHTNNQPDMEFNNLYYGPSYSDSKIRSAIKSSKLEYMRLNENPLCSQVAEALADGNIVGWFQGRMEFGARALGNRSILADPRSQDSLDRVNANVKNRESWRPFAPSLIYEESEEYLKNGGESPYMILLDYIDEKKHDVIPAVTHVDGSTRPQTVKKGQNERYYKLLKEFENITGVPVLLNTSFNVSGEPIVESPKQAIADFYTTGIDILVIGNYILKKPDTTIEGFCTE